MKKKKVCMVMQLCWMVFFVQAQPPKTVGMEERLQHISGKLSKELKLTEAQKEKVNAVYRDFFQSIEKFRDNNTPPPPPPPVDKTVVDKLGKERDEKIKAVLTPVQFAKYAEIEKTLRPPAPGQPGMPPVPKNE